MAKETSSGSGFGKGLLFGLLAGAVVAVLFAPQPGVETREQLAEQSVLWRKRAAIFAQQFVEQMIERYGEAKTQANDAYERNKNEVLARYEKAKNA